MVLSADDYLADGDYAKSADAKIINLCHYERYQSPGYYVSLLAEARGQAALPAMKTVGDLQDGHMGALASAAFLEELQPLLADRRDDEFAITVVFGRDLSGGSDAIASKVFEALPAPLLQVHFTKSDSRWQTSDVRVLCASELAPDQRTRVGEVLMQYLRGAGRRRADSRPHAPSLAILHDADEPDPPSNTEAFSLFLRTARELEASIGSDRAVGPFPPCGIRRPIHTRYDPSQSLHLSIRANGSGGWPGGNRRSRVHFKVHQQSIPPRAAWP